MINLKEKGSRCNSAIFPFVLSGFLDHTEHASCFFQRQHEVRAGGAVPAVGLLCVMQCDHDELENVHLLRGLGSKPIWLCTELSISTQPFSVKQWQSQRPLSVLLGFVSFYFVLFLNFSLGQRQNGRG